MGTRLNNLLRDSIAALRGAPPLAYPQGMSRSLRSVRLALKPLATVISILENIWRVVRRLSGDDGYERYLAHCAVTHPEQQVLSRRAWFAYEQQQKWTGIKRCC